MGKDRKTQPDNTQEPEALSQETRAAEDSKQWLAEERRRAREEEKKNLANMGLAGKLQYFWDYYKFVLVIAVCVIAAASLARTIYINATTDTVLSVVMMNTAWFSGETTELEEAFTEYIGGLEEKQALDIDASLSLDVETNAYSEANQAAVVKLAAYSQSGGIDVVLMPESLLEYMASQGLVQPLDELLAGSDVTVAEDDLWRYAPEPETEEMYGEEEDSADEAETSAARDGAVSADGAAADGTEAEGAAVSGADSAGESGEEATYAICLGADTVLQEWGYYGDEPVYFAVGATAKHTDMALKMLAYLMGE